MRPPISRSETEPDCVKVFVLSGHALLRHALSELLQDEGFDVVGEAGTIGSALERVTALAPDVALVENRLPDGTGIEACRALRSADPSTQCVILTTYEEGKALRSVVLSGAAGYVLQNASGAGLTDAVRKASTGHKLHTSEALRAALIALAEAAWEGTAVEAAILSLILSGRTDLQIGEELALSPGTLAGHLSSLLAKLGYRPAPEGPPHVPRSPA